VTPWRDHRFAGVEQMNLGASPFEPGEAATEALRNWHRFKSGRDPEPAFGLDRVRSNLKGNVVQHPERLLALLRLLDLRQLALEQHGLAGVAEAVVLAGAAIKRVIAGAAVQRVGTAATTEAVVP
jgi:hypothetical protein